jgi:hypothetical protein
MNTPFSAEERLFRYAKTYMAYRDFNALEIAHDIKQTTFVVTGLLDEHSNMENSQAACPLTTKAITTRSAGVGHPRWKRSPRMLGSF